MEEHPTANAKETSKEIVNIAMKKKLVIRKGRWYYRSVEGKHLKISQSKQYTGEYLEEMGLGSMETISDNDPDQTQNKAEAPSRATSPENKKSSDNDEKSELYSELVETFGLCKPVPLKGSDIVLIHGIDSRLTSHPLVANFPIVVRWRLKSHNVHNGTDIIMSKDWMVINKNHKAITKYIKVLSDESPEDWFYRRGEMYLCGMPRKVFFEKKEKTYTQHRLRTSRALKRRKEQGQNIGKVDDPREMMKNLERINAQDANVENKHFEEQARFNQQVNKVLKNTKNITVEEAMELAESGH